MTELQDVLDGLPTEDLRPGEYFLNSYSCLVGDKVFIYPTSGGVLVCNVEDMGADVAPWSD